LLVDICIIVCSSDAEDFDVDKGFADESKEEEEDLALAVSSSLWVVNFSAGVVAELALFMALLWGLWEGAVLAYHQVYYGMSISFTANPYQPVLMTVVKF